MDMGSIFNIAGSGMNAQSVRLNTTASNLANADSASSSTDTTYKSRQAVFASIQNGLMTGSSLDDMREGGVGVQVLGIVESDAPLQARYEPNHPLANKDGYVYYPNVNVVEEMANMMSASRSYDANVEMFDTAKHMMQRVLTLGQ